jgi:hypothetical protein
MTTHLEDWIAETPESIAARLEASREAQRQTRFALGILAVISMMMVILAYNAYLSYDSRWVLAYARDESIQKEPKIRQIDSADNADSVPDVLIVQALQDWAESRNATIELLGIRVSVDDAPVLGTISLFVISLWLLLVTRRENHTVGSLLRDTDTPGGDRSSSLVGDTQLRDMAPQLYSNGQRWLIFHSIFANNLFVTFDRWSRIDSLRKSNARVHDDPIGIKRRLDGLSMSFARGFFFWFPVVSSSFVFALDRLSYFLLADPFAPQLEPPGYEAPWFFASALVFVLCWIPLVICCRGAARYSRATGKVLREYGERLRADLLVRTSHETENFGSLNAAAIQSSNKAAAIDRVG